MKLFSEIKSPKTFKDIAAFFDQKRFSGFSIAGLYTFIFAILLQLIDGIFNPYRDTMLLLFPVSINSLIPILMTIWLLSIVVLFIKQKYKGFSFREFFMNQPVIILFAITFLLLFISELSNGWKSISWNGDAFRHEGIFTYFRYLLVYFPLGILVTEDRYKLIFVRVCIILSTAVGIFGLWKQYCVEEVFIDETTVCALWNNSNHYGYYLAINIILAGILFIYENKFIWKILDILILAFQIVVLTLNNTFGAWLAVFTTYALYLVASSVKNRKLNKSGLISFAVFIGVTLLTGIWNNNITSSLFMFFTDFHDVMKNPEEADSAGSSRWVLWKATMKYISEKPLLGWGVEGISQRLKIEAGTERTHNEYLQYAAFFGIPNVICYITGCVMVFLRAVRRWNEIESGTKVCVCGALAYFISATFGVSMYYTAPLFYIFLGLGYENCEENSMTSENSRTHFEAFLGISGFSSIIMSIVSIEAHPYLSNLFTNIFCGILTGLVINTLSILKGRDKKNYVEKSRKCEYVIECIQKYLAAENRRRWGWNDSDEEKAEKLFFDVMDRLLNIYYALAWSSQYCDMAVYLKNEGIDVKADGEKYRDLYSIKRGNFDKNYYNSALNDIQPNILALNTEMYKIKASIDDKLNGMEKEFI